ncbi:MAG: ABC transporter permease [Actinomycetota bacterium]
MSVINETNPGPGLAGSDFSGDARATTVGGAFREYRDRLRGGDTGSLPAVLGLVVLAVVFSVLRPETFPSTGNIANLMVQAGAICVLAMGLVPVLLLGDIDLSAGVAGGASAGVMAILITDKGLPWYVGVLGALVTGMVIGLVIGTLVSRLGIPSFVVTLAFFLGLQGITLKLIGQGGTVPVRDPVIVGIANRNLPVTAGWVVAILAIALYAVLSLVRYRSQASAGLVRSPLAVVLLRIAALGVIVLVITYVLNLNRAANPNFTLRGIPYVVPVVVVLLVGWTFVFSRTRYGRHIYAIGGNTEAARRAGINVTVLRTSVFVICSGMAALSGIVAASRLNSVTPDAGAGNTLLYAVGAAVIGGTSLFGGKGKMRDAIVGAFVVAVIANGLGLLNQKADVNYLVTGFVLLLAASVDAITRRRRSAAGR